MGDHLKEQLVSQALEMGFVACRVCRPWDVPEVPARLEAFVTANYHGQMEWMAERTGWRGNPSALWPEAKSVIMLAESYTPEHDPLAVLEQREKGAISVYAQNRDYHDMVKKRLKRLARWLIDHLGDHRTLDDNECALIYFIADNAPAIHPLFKDYVHKAAAEG